MISLWRSLVYTEMKQITLSGTVLDVGGSLTSVYHKNIKGTFTIEAADLSEDMTTNHTFDFEKPFPLPDASYQGVLCINVLEHIYAYQNVLDEMYRILKPGGVTHVAVPFLIRVHPSPNDYWRYSEQTLRQLFTDTGFTSVTVTPIGTGVFGAAYSLTHNVWRVGLLQWPLMKIACAADALLSWLAPNSSFTKRNYPLGYIVTAHK